MPARGSHPAKLTHDRVQRVIQGHAHRDRRIDRGPLRPGPHPLLADLLIGRHGGGGDARGHRAQRPPSPAGHGGAGLHAEPGGQGHPGQADHRCQVDPGAGRNPHAEQGRSPPGAVADHARIPNRGALRPCGRSPGEAAPAAPADGTQVCSRVTVQFRPVLRRQPAERAHLPTYVLPVMVPPACACCCGMGSATLFLETTRPSQDCDAAVASENARQGHPEWPV